MEITSPAEVVNFFVDYEEFSGISHKDYSLMCNKEWELLKYVAHSGSYILVEGDSPQINLFRITLPPKCEDFDELKFKQEFALWTSYTLKRHPNLDNLEFKIFEHTLSEFGIYTGHYLPDSGLFSITKTSWGRKKTICSDIPMDKFIEKVRCDHWYSLDI